MTEQPLDTVIDTTMNNVSVKLRKAMILFETMLPTREKLNEELIGDLREKAKRRFKDENLESSQFLKLTTSELVATLEKKKEENAAKQEELEAAIKDEGTNENGNEKEAQLLVAL